MADREKVINALEVVRKGYVYKKNGQNVISLDVRFVDMILALLKEQEDLGTELTNAMELIHKKNERIKKLEEQIETLTKWRMNAGAFD